MMAEGDKINGLLTGGLGIGLAATDMMITATVFTIGPISITVLPDASGSKPLQAGEIKDFYKPVDPINRQPSSEPFYTPYQVPVKKKHVKVELKFGNFEIEKEYLVREDRIKVLIKVLNLVGRVQNGLRFTVRGLRRIATKAYVKVLRLRKRN